jgi:hypothetical protein
MLAATSVGQYALFAGGNADIGSLGGSSNTVDIFNSLTGLWSKAALSQARANLVATTVGNYAIFAGGEAGPYSDVVDIFNSLTGQWTTASFPSSLMEPSAATSVGNYALFGGDSTDVVDILAVPEPATLALLAMGGLAILRRRAAFKR